MTTRTESNHTATDAASTARALDMHRDIAACRAHIAHGQGIHALTAMLMLPCYEAGFRQLAQRLTSTQQSELRTALQARKAHA